MPEGHTIHRLARRLSEVFEGEELAVSSPQGRFARGARLLDGRRLVSARAYGKQLHLTFALPADPDDRLVMRSHLGLYGAWSFAGDDRFAASSSIGAPRKMGERESGSSRTHALRYDDGRVIPDPPVGAVRARLAGRHGWADLRGPAECRVETVSEAAMALKRLGPDPLNPAASPDLFVARASRSARPIAALLLEQQVIAGVGNIFRAESLFRQGVDPFLPSRAAGEETLLGLWQENRELMEIGVRLGRIVTTDPEDRPGIPETAAWPEHANYVYKRTGEPCLHCGTPVREMELAGRNLFWCPGCQPPSSP
ncbi:Fpg/Nei family DNA glycosylase [Kocuria coralli]|uniref:DNA-(apurinic or apyrimidinic site) lyase n=1 Tax=Kocuria coralli TaxID=1461025 RepID=A0A5J5KWB3_9MICC|nr:zinc finger domain-containing protein [Kocuria coralli]KAA9394037.1 Fpg/Nei family DNA glycosylase [Kocuria coralli]